MTDAFGHGTHVAGIIAGNPAPANGVAPEYAGGIAPGAQLVNVRVLGADGSGFTSDVIAGIEWVVANRALYNIRVINLSLGHPVTEACSTDPLCEAVNQAVQAGIVVVVAAGNAGKAPDGRAMLGGISSPGNSPYAITVGALNTWGTVDRSDDTVATFSSRGPSAYDLAVKPDMAAPGTKILSLQADGAFLPAMYPSIHVAGSGNNAYMYLSGTSMAAPMVSGGVALLLQGSPNLSPAQVKFALQNGATAMTDGGLMGAGAGSVNFWASRQIAVYGASPASAQTAPSLGAAQSFAVLGASTVTNTGSSVITGDLGVSPGTAVTGFPPGLVVSGTIHGADAAALAAQDAVTAAYNSLVGQACTQDLTGQDLGGQTLTAGVYCFSSSAQLTGTLTLNAQGNANAVFIFKMGSTLTTASASSVVLINGGSPGNVFWQVGSSATLGTAHVVRRKHSGVDEHHGDHRRTRDGPDPGAKRRRDAGYQRGHRDQSADVGGHDNGGRRADHRKRRLVLGHRHARRSSRCGHRHSRPLGGRRIPRVGESVAPDVRRPQPARPDESARVHAAEVADVRRDGRLDGRSVDCVGHTDTGSAGHGHYLGHVGRRRHYLGHVGRRRHYLGHVGRRRHCLGHGHHHVAGSAVTTRRPSAAPRAVRGQVRK